MKVNKIYCDNCNCEIDDNNKAPSEIETSQGFTIDISIEDIDLCRYCFINAVNKLDDRPKAA